MNPLTNEMIERRIEAAAETVSEGTVRIMPGFTIVTTRILSAFRFRECLDEVVRAGVGDVYEGEVIVLRYAKRTPLVL